MGGNGGAGALRTTVLHVLFSIPPVALAFSHFSAGLVELLRPAVLSLSASVSDYLSDRKCMFLFFSVVLFLVAGDSSFVASSGSGSAGFVDEILSQAGHVWLASSALDAEPADPVDGGGAGQPGIGIPEVGAADGEERAEDTDMEMDEAEKEDREGIWESAAAAAAEEKEERDREEEEEEVVDEAEFRRKCDAFIEKVKRERVMEALRLHLV